MNVLVVEAELTGPDPALCAVASYGLVLLSDSLQIIEEGGDLLKPRVGLYAPPEVEALALIDGENLLNEGDFLDHVRSLAQTDDTILASQSGYQTRKILDALVVRNGRQLPSTISDSMLDVRAMAVASTFSGSVSEAYDTDLSDVYLISREQAKYTPSAFVDAKVTALLLSKLLCKPKEIGN